MNSKKTSSSAVSYTHLASLSSCPVKPRIEAVFRDADASACPQDTELGGAVAQVVGGTLADVYKRQAQYLVQTAYVRFKVQYEESWAQCRHYSLLLSSIRITPVSYTHLDVYKRQVLKVSQPLQGLPA